MNNYLINWKSRKVTTAGLIYKLCC